MITSLMPIPKQQFFAIAGIPLVGGKVYTFAAGTTDPKPTYTDAAGTTEQPNPIPLNARGEPANPIFWSGNYRVELRDALGNVVYTIDNYNTDPAGVWSWLTKLADKAGAALIGFIQAGAGAIARTVQDRLRDTISAKDFGAMGDGVADDTAAIQAAALAATGRVLFIPFGTYKLTAGVTFYGDVRADRATFKFNGATIAKLVQIATEGSITGLVIDGAGVVNCQNGLFVDTDFAQKATCSYDLVIKNISNADNTTGCNGATFYKASTAIVNPNTKLDIRIDVSSVTATANGINGDTGGSSCGILVSFNGAGTDASVKIHDCTIRDILPAEDSAGVQLVTGDYASTAANGLFTIQNVAVYNAKKRGIKVQAPNTTVRDCVVYGQDTTIGFDSYAPRTTFERCRHVSGNSTAFRLSGIYARVLNCFGESTTQQPMLYMQAGANTAVIANTILRNLANLAAIDNAIINITDCTEVKLDTVSAVNGNNTGSGLSVAGTTTCDIINCVLTGVKDGIYLPNSSGVVSVNNSVISALTNGVERLGAQDQTLIVTDSTITAGSIGVNAQGSGIAMKVNINNTTINANGNGVIAPDGSRIINSTITSTGTTGNGIIAGNSVYRGNRINKYAVGISYTYTTTAEVFGNVTVGSTLPYEKTGYTAFVDVNNYSR